MKISALLITITIMSVIMAAPAEVAIPSAFSQFGENLKGEQSFLLKARIIVNDPGTKTVEIKLKSENVAQEQLYDRSLDNNSKTRLKFKFNEALNTPYEICAESIQDKDVYACKGGLLSDNKPNITLTL
ncbi:MAG: hypothetical protein ACPKPY_07360 [Nitrososphaeraceae archaeon]